MLDHVSLRVTDFDRAIAFYKEALSPLGYSLLVEFPGVAGFGAGGKPDFWVTRSDKPTNPTHIAFASDRATVAKFHAAALAAGGTDNGPAGVRPEYHPHYYGAFVFDPEGNNVEACSHAPAASEQPKAGAATSGRAPARGRAPAAVATQAKGRAPAGSGAGASSPRGKSSSTGGAKAAASAKDRATARPTAAGGRAAAAPSTRARPTARTQSPARTRGDAGTKRPGKPAPGRRR